jgi:hypothetical protein
MRPAWQRASGGRCGFSRAQHRATAFRIWSRWPAAIAGERAEQRRHVYRRRFHVGLTLCGMPSTNMGARTD